VIWDLECAASGGRVDTPERRAGLEHRLEQRAFAIADGKVQRQYLDAFRGRVRALSRPAPGPAWRAVGSRDRFPRRESRDSRRDSRRDTRYAAHYAPAAAPRAGPPMPPEGGAHRREQAVLATLINHWALMDEFAEAIGTLPFADPALDRLRQEILILYGSLPDLDSDAVARHLRETGGPEGLRAVLSPDVYRSARSAHAESDAELARTGLCELVDGMRLEEAKRLYAAQPTEENFARLQECRMTRARTLRESV
jgi:DNA primase